MCSLIDILGDAPGFYELQRSRLARRGIAIDGWPLSHIAYRVPEHGQYLHLRTLLERHALANIENVWNGRPISKILLREPLDLGHGASVDMIELIPPVHQRVYKMGLEHVGVVVGEEVDDFGRRHRAVLTGQQFQSPVSEPYYVLFEDFTHVKFYRHSLRVVCEWEGRRFEGFHHVPDWRPDVLHTATRGDVAPR